jgi:hypothetical protein
LRDRVAAYKLVPHREKMEIVYCKNAKRRGGFQTIRSISGAGASCQGLKRNVSIIAEAAAATNGSAGSGTVAGTVEAITRKAILTVGCDKRAAVKQALDSDAGCLGCFAYPWRTPIVFSVEFRSLNLSISL